MLDSPHSTIVRHLFGFSPPCTAEDTLKDLQHGAVGQRLSQERPRRPDLDDEQGREFHLVDHDDNICRDFWG